MNSSLLELLTNSEKSVILNASIHEGKDSVASKSIIEILKSGAEVSVLSLDDSHSVTETVERAYKTVSDRFLMIGQKNSKTAWLVFPEYLAQLSEIKISLGLIPILFRGNRMHE